jgi:hypothetical protein
MAFDPELIAETRAWFSKAFNDLRAAEALVATSPPLFDEAAFHCQQAAEKALKGFLTWNGRTFRKTHNLEEIVIARGHRPGGATQRVCLEVPVSRRAFSARIG